MEATKKESDQGNATDVSSAKKGTKNTHTYWDLRKTVWSLLVFEIHENATHRFIVFQPGKPGKPGKRA